MRGLYYVLIYPYLIVTLYGKNDMHTTRLEQIRRLQRKIIRIFTFSNFKEHTGPLFKELLISPLDDINNEAIALFMFRYFNNNLPSSFNDFFCLNKDVHQFNTRSSSTFTKSKHEPNYQKHSVKYKLKEFQYGITCQIYKRNKYIQFIQKKN